MLGRIAAILFLYPCFAAATWSSAPILKRQLVAVNPLRFSVGLCPGNPLRVSSPPLNIINPRGAFLFAAQLNTAAIRSAQDIYSLPDLQTAATAQQVKEQLDKFAARIPEHYTIYTQQTDTLSGLKFAIFKPDQPDRPWILALAGTQTALDWIVDVDMGRPQLQQLLTLSSVFTTCQYLDETGQPLASHSWVVTGHSLGGGLAQAFSYHVQRNRLGNGLLPLRMQTLTFNAFGAQPLIQKIEDFNPSLIPYINARNYFMEGDVVSRVGKHVGPTYMIRAAHGPKPPLISRETIRRHQMTNLEEIADDLMAIFTRFMMAVPRKPDYFFDLSVLGSVAQFFPSAIYLTSAATEKRIDTLEQMVSDILSHPDLAEIKDYVHELILQELIRLDRESVRGRDIFLARLQDLLFKI